MAQKFVKAVGLHNIFDVSNGSLDITHVKSSVTTANLRSIVFSTADSEDEQYGYTAGAKYIWTYGDLYDCNNYDDASIKQLILGEALSRMAADSSLEELTLEVSTNKQDNLVSGNNIKTFNGNSILESGNVQYVSSFGGHIGDISISSDFDVSDGELRFIKEIPQNLIIGSEAERLALEDPQEGLEFNEVTYLPDIRQYKIIRYMRLNGQWEELEIPQKDSNETVSLHISTYDGLGQLEGVSVGIRDVQTEVTIQRQLDSYGNCTFQIPKGHTYTISIADVPGYHSLPAETYLAEFDTKTINKMLYSATTSYENLVVHISVYNASAGDITASDTDFIGMQIPLYVDGSETPIYGTINNNHECTFSLNYGATYTLTAPSKNGYMRKYQITFSNIAGVPYRLIPLHYQVINTDIFAIDANGDMYTYNQAEEMTEQQKASLIAICINTSRLQTAGAGFMYKIPKSSTTAAWAGSNVEFDKTKLPYKQSHAVAVLDLDGASNTQNIRDIGDSMSVGTPAADWCYNQTITVAGIVKHGFLGAYGQMYALYENKDILNAWHTMLGISLSGFTSGYWWSSSQYNDTTAVDMSNGGFYFDNKNTSNFNVVAFFAL